MGQTCDDYVKIHTRHLPNNGYLHFPEGPVVTCFSDLITKDSDNHCIHYQWTAHPPNNSAAGTVEGKRDREDSLSTGSRLTGTPCTAGSSSPPQTWLM